MRFSGFNLFENERAKLRASVQSCTSLLISKTNYKEALETVVIYFQSSSSNGVCICCGNIPCSNVSFEVSVRDTPNSHDITKLLQSNISLQNLLEKSCNDSQQRELQLVQMKSRFDQEKYELTMKYQEELSLLHKKSQEATARSQLEVDSRFVSLEQFVSQQVSTISVLESLNRELRQKVDLAESEKNDATSRVNNLQIQLAQATSSISNLTLRVNSFEGYDNERNIEVNKFRYKIFIHSVRSVKER